MIRKTLFILSLVASSFVYGQQEDVKKFTVDDCFEYALKNSPDIKKRILTLSSSKHDIDIQRAVFDLSLSGGASRNMENETNSSSLVLNQEVPGGINITAAGDLDSDDDDGSDEGALSLIISKQILGGG